MVAGDAEAGNFVVRFQACHVVDSTAGFFVFFVLLACGHVNVVCKE